MTITKLLMILALIVAIAFRETYGYGRMINPLGRSSLWRKNFPSKINRADGYLNCGGSNVQFEKNEGKCGECGDDYSLPRPRPNENGGTYGNGMISRAYKKGSVINVTIELSGYYEGQFDFHICPLRQDKRKIEEPEETEKCFRRYHLQLATDNGHSFNVTKTNVQLRDIVVSLKLPRTLFCTHCVLRWQFRSVDDYYEENGMLTVHIATWRNCADIAILKYKT